MIIPSKEHIIQVVCQKKQEELSSFSRMNRYFNKEKKMNCQKNTAYVGLGGNIGDTLQFILTAIEQITLQDGIQDLICSNIYRTTPVTPVGGISQPVYLNAACRFQTTLPALELLHVLQQIESQLGRIPSPKNSPRVIDLDLLFFGTQQHQLPELIVPHPRWSERLFVLMPLSDLTDKIQIASLEPDKGTSSVDLQSLLQNFTNPHNETVCLAYPSSVYSHPSETIRLSK